MRLRFASMLKTVGIAALFVLALAPAAQARPGNLQPTQANRLVSASWTLPAGEAAWSFELSFKLTFPDEFGTYTKALTARQTSTTLDELLPGGTYYVRILSTPTPDLCSTGDPGCVFEYSDLASVVVPSQAANLHTVTQSGGVVTAAWSLPAGVKSRGAEISPSPDRNIFGFKDSLYSRDVDLDQTSFSFPALPPGYYYVEVESTPTPDACLNGAFDPGCVKELSNIVPVQVTAGSSGPPPPAGVALVAAPDKVVSLGAITASSSQDVDKLSITLNAGEALKVKLSGSVNVPGASKVYRLKTVSKSLGAGKTKLRLKLASKAKKAVKRALRRKKRLKAKLTLVVTDKAGNARTNKYSVRLKP